MAKITLAQYFSKGTSGGNYWLITCECGKVNKLNPGNWARTGGKRGCTACGGILNREDAIPAMDNLAD